MREEQATLIRAAFVLGLSNQLLDCRLPVGARSHVHEDDLRPRRRIVKRIPGCRRDQLAVEERAGAHLDARTPCDEWDVRTLLNHMIEEDAAYGSHETQDTEGRRRSDGHGRGAGCVCSADG